MYGYVRPNRGELKVRDYELFCAAYCGLCHTLRRRCGVAARFVVNYDLTFLAMLLSAGGDARCRRFCPAHPLRRPACVTGCTDAYEAAADYSVLLAWWKLDDQIRDGNGLKKLAARLGRFFLRGPAARARAARPDFDAALCRSLTELSRLEAEDCASLDRMADCFASILAGAADAAAEEERRRILRDLLYHLGRSIYILDAADDFDEDAAAGNYNVVRARFGPAMTQETRQALRRTLNLSQRSMAGALLLLPPGDYTAILENVVTVGLPQLTELVLTGQWKERKRLVREYSRKARGELI